MEKLDLEKFGILASFVVNSTQICRNKHYQLEHMIHSWLFQMIDDEIIITYIAAEED